MATSGASTAYPSGVPGFTPRLLVGVRVALSLVFYVIFCKSLFVLISLFSLDIVLSVLILFELLITPLVSSDYLPLVSSDYPPLVSSDYPFGTFKLVLPYPLSYASY